MSSRKKCHRGVMMKPTGRGPVHVYEPLGLIPGTVQTHKIAGICLLLHYVNILNFPPYWLRKSKKFAFWLFT